MALRIELLPDDSRIILAAGDARTVHIRVTNDGPAADVFTVAAGSIEPSWLTLSPSQISLGPGEVSEVTLQLHPPRQASSHAGTRTFDVLATSQGAPGEQSS